MKTLDFYSEVLVLPTADAELLGVAGKRGVIVGIAEEDGKAFYAVSIGDRSYALTDADVQGAGKGFR